MSALAKHARTWVAVVSEAWVLARRRVAVIVIVGAVLASIGCCGTAATETTPPSQPGAAGPVR